MVSFRVRGTNAYSSHSVRLELSHAMARQLVYMRTGTLEKNSPQILIANLRLRMGTGRGTMKRSTSTT
ncbi:hypothetical protein BGY98DRAFT_1006692, partial [Russula aff. rugulosa BPL654]